MAINTKFSMKLSLDSIEEYKKMITELEEKIPQLAGNIVDRLSEEGLKDNYSSTEKIPVEILPNKATGGIRTTDVGATFAEFGTGIVGAEKPHENEWIEQSGWQYDVNGHGEEGWVYYKDGEFHWTKGQPAQKRFYDASVRMEEKFKPIAVEEIGKILNG